MEDKCDKCERSFEKAPLGYKFKRINEMFKARMNEDMKRNGLTFSQNEILFYLTKNQDHEVSQQEICDALQVAHPTIIGLINRMEEKGLVERTVNPANRRKRCIVLTEKAQQIMLQTRERRDHNDRLIVRNMSEEEQRTLNHLLTRIYDNMQDESFWK